MIHILVVSPIPALRAGLRALLSSDPDLVVDIAAGTALSAAAGVAQEASTASERAQPGDTFPGNELSFYEVVVAMQGSIDLAAPGLQPEQALLLVTDDAQEIQALPGLELRAWGAIAPDSTAEALQAAVRALVGGLVAASPALLRQALAAGPGSALHAPQSPFDEETGAPLDPLTERENDVLLRLAQGLTNKQIALALSISEHTVKFHVSSIYSKLGVSNRTEAVRKGARRGLIPL